MMVLSPTYRNLSSVNGEDHAGRMIAEMPRALVASGFWRRKHQGDGLAAYSSGTSDLFTGNGGLGYGTSGSWPRNVANTTSNQKAYVVLEEVVNNVATGRQLLLQHSSSTGAGLDRFVVIHFAWTAFTGSPNATTAPAAPTLSAGVGTINSVGVNLFKCLTTSPQMGGAGGTIIFNYWVCDEPSGTTDDVCPFAVEIYDSTADEPAVAIIYDALRDAAASDAHPCVISLPSTGAAYNTTWEYGEARNVVPATHNPAGGSQCMFAVDSDTGAAVSACTIHRIGLPDAGQYPNGTAGLASDIDGKVIIYPAGCFVDKTGGPFKGTFESVENNFALHLWPDTTHASVADPDEPPRISLGHVTLPWEVGVARTGLAGSTNYTDVRRVMPYVEPETPDSTPPSITFNQAAGAVAYDATLTVDITDNLGELAAYHTVLQYAGRPDEHVADWVGGSLLPSSDYDAATSHVTITNGYRLSVKRDVGYPEAFTLRVTAIDQTGNILAAERSYTISTSPNPAADDSALPTIENISPAPASELVSDDTAIEFDVLDDRGLSYFAVFARYLDKREYDVVWDGEDFAPKYAGSTVEAISDGWHFEVVRDVENVGGWTTQGRVRFKAVAVDTAGNAEAA